ncbi:hypothetical protein PHJA_002208500 [Phtheirospermum japonicum]|uniref:Uncharacterized protein n=1 Tax=Phtheirospermum japonicum TaxID=374723 RepID=A0A830D072_9LAMI|nr:hypothetical protein PHJA_002208500 [Phtheirospermum japonicum]
MPSAVVNSTTTTATPPGKRLLFDRRYGWVLDEWKEPSEEALTGGRGMFCIVPLAKELFHKASESINFVGSATLNVIEKPDLLSPKAVHATLSDQMQKIASSVKNIKLLLMGPKGNNEMEFTSCSSDQPNVTIGSETDY